MAKQDLIEATGEVTNELGNSMFRVKLDNLPEGSEDILCTLSGKIKLNQIRINTGDKVKVELSPYDLTRGRIVHRLRVSNVSTQNSRSNNNKKKAKNAKA